MPSASPRSRRAANPLKVVVAAGLAGAVVLAAAFVWLSALGNRSSARAGVPGTVVVREPVVSARRTPGVLSFVTRTSKVRAALASTVARLPADSCLDVHWLGAEMASVRAGTAYVPGSAVKLVTAGVALEVLGPDARFTTSVRATRNPDGSVADLYVVGGGDPLLVRSEYVATERLRTFNATTLESLADAVVGAGVTRITGRVVGVDTYFDAERWVKDWPVGFRFVEAGPLGALMANDGAVVGQALKPDDPALAAATEIVSLLAARGVSAGAGVAHEALPQGTEEITSVRSAPLADVLEEMLVNSDNNTAEIILKHIGLKAGGTGSTAAGLEAVADHLKKWGGGADAVVTDGSGLSSSNRIPCATFRVLLDRFRSTMPGLLAVAGETGTLETVFTDSAVRGVMQAKTGTLSGVKALVGYLPVEGDDPVRFSLLMNRQGIDNKSAYRPVWNSLADSVSRASGTPRPEDLAP